MIEVTTQSEAQTMLFAEAMAKLLRAGDVIALDGPLGAGKTRFVKGLVRGLGLDEKNVSSPTFVISHEYSSNGDERDAITLVHIDAYRLRDPAELESIGWDELLTQDNTIIAVEWAERIESALPKEHVRVELEHVSESERRIMVDDRTDCGASRLESLAKFTERDGNAHQCPICSKRIEAGTAVDIFPFCSPRCRMVDLGRWFSGSRMITRPIEESDLYED